MSPFVLGSLCQISRNVIQSHQQQEKRLFPGDRIVEEHVYTHRPGYIVLINILAPQPGAASVVCGSQQKI
jgi:hypothetical protein